MKKHEAVTKAKVLAKRTNSKIKLADAIWAGQMVEPRILEVLPAAFAKYADDFEYQNGEESELKKLLKCFEIGSESGPDFLGFPYEKTRKWYLFITNL